MNSSSSRSSMSLYDPDVPTSKKRALDFLSAAAAGVINGDIPNTPPNKRFCFSTPPPLLSSVRGGPLDVDLVSLALKAPVGTSLKSIFEAPGLKPTKADLVAAGRSLLDVCRDVLDGDSVELASAWSAKLPEKGWDDTIHKIKTALWAEEGQRALDRLRTQFPVVQEVVTHPSPSGKDGSPSPVCPIDKANCVTRRDQRDGGVNCAEHGHLFRCNSKGCSAWLHLSQATCLGCGSLTAYGEARNASNLATQSLSNNSGESHSFSCAADETSKEKDFVFPVGLRPDQKRALERHLKPVLKLIQNCTASVEKLPLAALLMLPPQQKQLVQEAFDENHFLDVIRDDHGRLRAGMSASSSKATKVSATISTNAQAVEVIEAWFSLQAIIHPSTEDVALATRDYFLFDHRLAWRELFGLHVGEQSFYIPVLAWIDAVRRKYQHLRIPLAWSLEGDRLTMWADIRMVQSSKQSGQITTNKGQGLTQANSSNNQQQPHGTTVTPTRYKGPGGGGRSGANNNTPNQDEQNRNTTKQEQQQPQQQLQPPPRICFRFKNGSCRFGSSCTFSHVDPQGGGE